MNKIETTISTTNRRNFIKNAVLASLGFSILSSCNTEELFCKQEAVEGIIPDPNDYLSLPPGFSYKIIS